MEAITHDLIYYCAHNQLSVFRVLGIINFGTCIVSCLTGLGNRCFSFQKIITCLDLQGLAIEYLCQYPDTSLSIYTQCQLQLDQGLLHIWMEHSMLEHIYNSHYGNGGPVMLTSCPAERNTLLKTPLL